VHQEYLEKLQNTITYKLIYKIKIMHNKKYDPAMERLKPGSKVGIVGGQGSSSGRTGMEILKAPSMYKGGPITEIAKGR